MMAPKSKRARKAEGEHTTDGDAGHLRKKAKLATPDPELVDRWKQLYATDLPKAARAKSGSQKKWPVTLDHCFARIILDNTVGRGEQPWTAVIRSPAYKHMSEQHLKDAIELGTGILEGRHSLVELDEKSLAARGKKSKQRS